MKKTLLCVLLCLLLCGCAAGNRLVREGGGAGGPVCTIRDSEGIAIDVPGDPKVVCLYGSYAEAWLLAGGTLAGVTQDAVSERNLDVGGAPVVGTVKEPSAEEIIALEPDLVVLNPDITGQAKIRALLEQAGLACAAFRVDGFEDYAAMMEQFCAVTGRDDLYEQNVLDVKKKIEDVKERAALSRQEQGPTVLLIRAFSSGMKAKTDDELAGAVLKDLGARNIADEHPSMLEDLSLEEVIRADPGFIFVTTMGNEKDALAYLEARIDQNPAWQELQAVREGRCIVLPKDLFHYKPNDRWGESYEYLARILYSELDWD